VKRRAASVEEHPKGSGRYRVRARVGGKLRSLGAGLPEAEARELARAYEQVRYEREMRDGITLAQFGAGFLDRRERAGVRAIRTDRSSWSKNVASSALGALPVSTLVRRDVRDWLDGLGHLAHRTRQRVLNLLRVALDEAVERELLATNPARDVRVHRASAARATDDLDGILTPAEQQALVAAVPERDRALVVFALCTGLRQAEQWWLRWEDLLTDRVVVRRSAGGRPPKSGKPREVPLLPAAAAALAALPRRSPWVFPMLRGARQQEGKPPRHWASWVTAAGIDRHVRWHDLRHTCATSLLAGWWGRKWTLDEVCSLLGHSSVKVTERYARKLDSTLRDVTAATSGPVFPNGEHQGTQRHEINRSDGPFVKHRSSVQIRQSAQGLSASSWEHAGNIGEAELAALGRVLPAVAAELVVRRRVLVVPGTVRRRGAKRDAG
jgi:integrase